MKETILSPSILLKTTIAVHASAPLSLIQRKSINILLKNAFQDRRVIEDIYHEFSIQDLMRAMGYQENNRSFNDDLKSALFALLEIQITWNTLKKDQKYKTVGKSPYLASISIENGIIRYTFSKHMRDIFFKPYLYARLDLDYQKAFVNKNSIPLWEMMCEELSTKQVCEAQTSWIPYQKVLELFALENSSYTKSYRSFKSQVLKAIVNEINLKSDIMIHFEERKTGGRKVTDLKFMAKKKGDPTLVDQVEEILMNPLISPPDPAAPDAELLGRMRRFVAVQTAKTLIKKHEKQTLYDALDFCEHAFKARGETIQNPVAFLKKAIEEAWVLPEVMQLRLLEGDHELGEKLPYPEEDHLLQEMRDALMERIGDATYISWFARVRFEIDEEALNVHCPSDFHRDWIKRNYAPDLRAVADLSLPGCTIAFETIENGKAVTV